MPLYDALDTPDPTASVNPPDEPLEPIDIAFPNFTGNAKVDAFHTVMNATLKAVNERGYDSNFGSAIMNDELDDNDKRDAIGVMFGSMELDMLLLGALKAAEDRNNAAANAGQDGTLTGNEELDKLLAIILTQKSAEAETSAVITIDGTDELPERIKTTTDEICDDPAGLKLVDCGVPASIESEEDVNNGLFVLTSWDDEKDDDKSGADVLTSSLNSQTNAVVSSKTSDSEDLMDIFGLTDIKSMIMAQVIDSALNDFKEQFSKDPVKAVEAALDRLKKQLSGLNGFEQWVKLLENLKELVSTNMLWQVMADVLTGDYTALLTPIIDSPSGGDSNSGADTLPDASPDASADISPSPSQADADNDGVVPVDFDYTGYYALEFTLLDVSFEMQPYDPDNHMNHEPPFDISQSQWEERAETEQEELMAEPSFSYLTDTIQIWHEQGSDFVSADLTLPVDIAYQTDFELEDGSGSINSTIYFRPNEYSDGFGYITFIGGDDGSIAIIGEVTEYFEGGLNKYVRHFRIDGIQITEEEYYSW